MIEKICEEVTSHLHSEIPNPGFEIHAVGEAGPAGNYNQYCITYENPVAMTCNSWNSKVLTLQFQNGPVPDVGTNGITIEALVGICIHRLEGFQAGKFPCQENQEALEHLKASLAALHSRTLKRMARGVEGKLQE